MSLVEELVGLADAEGCRLARLSAGTVRYVAADAILSAARGHVAVHRRHGGGYDVAVWHDDDLAAWGHTVDTEHIAKTLCGWQDGMPIAELCLDGYLREADDAHAEEAVEAQWQLLLRYADAFVQPIAVATAAQPALRRLRPWLSHATLHLLELDYRAEMGGRGLAFHPTSGSAFIVNVYHGPVSSPLAGPQAAVIFAANVVSTW